jgi:hypothetical protein
MEIVTISPHQILVDLTDCVTTCNTKVSRRLKRLRVVCKLLCIDPDNYINQLIIQQEIFLSIDKDSINAYLSAPPAPDADEVNLPISMNKDTYIKSIIASQLTSHMNRDLNLYRLTSRLLHTLFSCIKDHPLLGQLVVDKKLLLIQKNNKVFSLFSC